MIWFGKAETADPFASRELRQVLLLCRLSAELVDRHHDEGRLNAHHRAITRVDSFHLACDEAVADIIQAGAAIALWNGRPEKAKFAHVPEDANVGLLVTERLLHPG